MLADARPRSGHRLVLRARWCRETARFLHEQKENFFALRIGDLLGRGPVFRLRAAPFLVPWKLCLAENPHSEPTAENLRS